MSSMSPQEPDATRRHRQRAGFSVFVDQIEIGHSTSGWQTRLYHAESGSEAVQDRVAPAEWISWMMDRLAGLDLELSPAALGGTPLLALISVHSLDPGSQSASAAGDTAVIRADFAIQMTSREQFEQEIGRQILPLLESLPQRPEEDDDQGR